MGLCEFDEGDAAWQLFGEGRVDQRYPAAPRQVAPDGVAGGLFAELGFEAGGAAGADDGVVEAGGHVARPDLEQPAGEGGQVDALAPRERVGCAEGNRVK